MRSEYVNSKGNLITKHVLTFVMFIVLVITGIFSSFCEVSYSASSATEQPSGLEISDQNDSNAVISWNPVTNAERYYIYYRKYDSSSWNYLGDTQTSVTQFTFDTGSLYTGRNEITVSTAPIYYNDDPVEGLEITEYTKVAPSDDNIYCYWEDGNIILKARLYKNDMDGLELFRSVNGGDWVKCANVSSDQFLGNYSTLYEDKPTVSGDYKYKYRYYCNGKYGKFSDVSDYTTVHYLSPPVIKGISAKGGTVTVNWEPDIKADTINFNVLYTYTYEGSERSYYAVDFNSPASSGSYTFKMDRSYFDGSLTLEAFTRNDNASSSSTETSFVCLDKPNIRSGIKTTSSAVELCWKKVAQAGGYYIYRLNKSTNKYEQITIVKSGGTTSYVDMSLKPDTKYTYKVRAFKIISGNSFISAMSYPLDVYTLPSADKIREAATKKPSLKQKKFKTKSSNLWGTEVKAFFDHKGNYNLVYESGKYLYINRMKSSNFKMIKRIKIKKRYPIFGSITCDKNGCYYVAWGNSDDKETKKKVTFAISKYTYAGKHKKTIGVKGKDINVKEPFHAGNCAMTFDGNNLVCNFARLMYESSDGLNHQACQTFAVNTKTMKKVGNYGNYVSHSFAQRAIGLKNGGVLFADHGDAYPRGFRLNDNKDCKVVPVHFNGRLGNNSTNATLGGVLEMSTGYVLTGASAKSLKTMRGNRQLFMVLIDPATGKSLLNNNKRIGTSCGKKVTDKGIKWLTNYKAETYMYPVDTVKIDRDRLFVMWQLSGGNKKVDGVYYMILSANGKVIRKETKLKKLGTGDISDLEYKNNCVYWTSHDYGSKKDIITLNKLDISKIF